ncbi:hypothetical protein THAOC_04792, partial [Thalassiosira oceanica]
MKKRQRAGAPAIAAIILLLSSSEISSPSPVAALSTLAPPPTAVGRGKVWTIPKKKPAQRPRTSGRDTTTVGTLTVPSVGCGTIAWDDSCPELASLVSSALEGGGAFFDTGERYGSHARTALGMGWGETESLIAGLLREAADAGPVPSPPAVVATKFTPAPLRTTAKSVVDACEKSRRRLGVDYIDLYQIQMPDIVKPLRSFGLDASHDEAYWDGLAECYHRGLVKNVGVSNYGPTLVERCHSHLAKRGVPLASNQIAYSLVGRGDGAQETLDKCNELGVKVLAYYPLAMGLLTGKYTSSDDRAGAPSLSCSKRSGLERRDLERYARGLGGGGGTVPPRGAGDLLFAMEDIARQRSKSVAQVALNYVICKGAIPIPGARDAAQLEDNLGASGWRLSPARSSGWRGRPT